MLASAGARNLNFLFHHIGRGHINDKLAILVQLVIALLNRSTGGSLLGTHHGDNCWTCVHLVSHAPYTLLLRKVARVGVVRILLDLRFDADAHTHDVRLIQLDQ